MIKIREKIKTYINSRKFLSYLKKKFKNKWSLKKLNLSELKKKHKYFPFFLKKMLKAIH